MNIFFLKKKAILMALCLGGAGEMGHAQVSYYLGGRIKDGDIINTDAAAPFVDGDGYDSRGGGSITWERDLYAVNGVTQTPWPPPDDPLAAPFLNMTCVNLGLDNPTDYRLNLTVVPARDIIAGYDSKNPADAGVDVLGPQRVGMIAYIYDQWFPGWEAIPSPGGHLEPGFGWVTDPASPEYIEQQAVSYLLGEIINDLPYHNGVFNFDAGDGGHIYINQPNPHDQNATPIYNKANELAVLLTGSGIDFSTYTSTDWEFFGATSTNATDDYQNTIIAAPLSAAPAPEPAASAAFLGIVGALTGILLRRRRRRESGLPN